MKFFQKLAEQYTYTLSFGALILLCTTPFNLLFPDPSYCYSGGVSSLYLYITAPFNIGCEASLLQLGTPDGLNNFLANFVEALGIVAVVEFLIRDKSQLYRRNLFVAAVLASYACSLISYSLPTMRGLQVGTSIVAISYWLYLIRFTVEKAWDGLKAKKNIKDYALWASVAVILGFFVFFSYTVQNATGHAMGGALFVLFFWGMLIKPDWLEEYVRIMKGKQARKK